MSILEDFGSLPPGRPVAVNAWPQVDTYLVQNQMSSNFSTFLAENNFLFPISRATNLGITTLASKKFNVVFMLNFTLRFKSNTWYIFNHLQSLKQTRTLVYIFAYDGIFPARPYYFNITNPNRINLPSPRPQWSSFIFSPLGARWEQSYSIGTD